MSRLRYTAANGAVLYLDSQKGNIRLQRLLGAGIPPVTHQVVRTPIQDGETYLGRTLLEPRFLIAEISVTDLCNWTDEKDFRRRVVEALNPKLGQGTLWYSPDGAAEYEIPALIETGVGFESGDLLGGFLRVMAISFRCSDPAWRNSLTNVQALATVQGGLSIPAAFDPTLDIDGNIAATAAITNSGDLASPPIITAAGPFETPILRNLTTGEYLVFAGLEVLTGQILTIDAGARTAKIGAVNVMGYRTFDSVLWDLEPGVNSISASVGAGATTFNFSWQQRWLGV